jgi:hypothetical protein
MSLKPYMFLSLLYDHPQGSYFVLSVLPLLRLFASSNCLFGMWLYVVYVCVCVCVPDVPVRGMSSCELSLIACLSCHWNKLLLNVVKI